jgi:hypothetical protein
MSNILDTLQIPVVAAEEVPKTFVALTVPISLDEDKLLTSMWSTLRGAPVTATIQDGSIVFWRRRIPSVGGKGLTKGTVNIRR